MKKDTLLKKMVGTPQEDLPEVLQERIKNDPALKAEFDQQARVAQLIGLKRYETPDDAMFGRVHYRTHLQINHQLHAPKTSFFTLWPAWARVTAVILFMLGLSILTHREMLRTEEEDPILAAPSPEAVDPVPPVFLMGSDPFQPYVFDPSRSDMTEFPSALTRKLEEDFEALGLTEINTLEPPTRLPVLFPSGK